MKKLFKNFNSNKGFMGPTHAFSALTVYLLLYLFFKDFLTSLGLDTDFKGLIKALIVVTGAALLPDLDSVVSTVITTLGPIGVILSKIMRSISVGIFDLTRTKYDDKEADPHRGFWHTIIAGLVVGTIVYISTHINIPISMMGITSIGQLIAIFWIFISFELALSGLIHNQVKKYKNSLIGMLFFIVLSLSVSILIVINSNSNYDWMAPAFTLGYIIHILGDTLTKAGTPLLFPFVTKGKRWYTHRILKIKTGGEIEKIFILPGFILISLVSLIFIIMKGF